MSSILKVDNLQTGAGATHSLSSLGVTGAGSVLQEIHGICDGRTVSGVTLPTCSGVQALTTTFTDITGSEISYTPPAGTTNVIYILDFHWQSEGRSGISHYSFFIDGTEATIIQRSQASAYGSSTHGCQRQHYEYPILIDSSLAADDIANLKLKSWTSARALKMQAREYNSSYQADLHNNKYWNGTGASGDQVFAKPTMTIKAIA